MLLSPVFTVSSEMRMFLHSSMEHHSVEQRALVV